MPTGYQYICFFFTKYLCFVVTECADSEKNKLLNPISVSKVMIFDPWSKKSKNRIFAFGAVNGMVLNENKSVCFSIFGVCSTSWI